MTEAEIAALCAQFVGSARLTEPESAFLKRVGPPRADKAQVKRIREAIRAGEDPLGEFFVAARSAAARRAAGAVYTPAGIVKSMVAWAQTQPKPARIVDPGAGSGRFLIAAAKMFPKAQLVASELDPLAALMLRANLAVLKLDARATVELSDFRKVALARVDGPTAYIGNPPYVRHHEIGTEWKRWYSGSLKKWGIRGSELAGLHLHFFLQAALLARSGDYGCFITSAEWMSVNYGSALRELLLTKLGGSAVHVLEPTVAAFPGTATTAAITCFNVGSTPTSIRMRSVASLKALSGLTRGKEIPRERVAAAHTWTILVRGEKKKQPGQIELGELFRVHRGQVTGGNQIWIEGEHSAGLPAEVRIPTITKARELIEAGAVLDDSSILRRVIDLPPELDQFTPSQRRAIEQFLRWAKSQGAHAGYIASHRKAWWSVGLKSAAPILVTYMARRAPQFTINRAGARHINVAHGLYPRQDMQPKVLAGLVSWLNGNTAIAGGRTYAGGLTKFEPKEIERLPIPSLDTLNRNEGQA